MITDVEPVAGRQMPSLGVSWERHQLGLNPAGLSPMAHPNMSLHPTSSVPTYQPSSGAGLHSLSSVPTWHPVDGQTEQPTNSVALWHPYSDPRLQPTSSSAPWQLSNSQSSGLLPTSSILAMHTNHLRGLRPSSTFPQPAGSQHDLISLDLEKLPGNSALPALEHITEAAPGSFTGRDLGPDAVLHDNPLGQAAPLSPTPILGPTPNLPRLNIPGSTAALEQPSQVNMCLLSCTNVRHATVLTELHHSKMCADLAAWTRGLKRAPQAVDLLKPPCHC